MKIISIQQPWAWLIIEPPPRERKDVENRTWRTSYRGDVLIHASGRPDRDATCARIESDFGIRPPVTLPMGGVIGIVEIVDCVTNHPSKWFIGDFGFVLRNPRPLPFFRCLGALGIRDAPPAVERFYRNKI